MSQNLQVRNLSDETHRALKARAAREGGRFAPCARSRPHGGAAGRGEVCERIGSRVTDA